MSEFNEHMEALKSEVCDVMSTLVWLLDALEERMEPHPGDVKVVEALDACFVTLHGVAVRL